MKMSPIAVVCAQLLDKAVAAYGGDFIVDLNVDSSAFDEWALLKREWLRRESLHALHVLVEYNERWATITAAYRYAWRRVEIDSLLEDAHQQVIRALALDGRQSAALAHYDTLRQILEDELGVEPAEETSALVASIRAGTLAPSSRCPETYTRNGHGTMAQSADTTHGICGPRG